MSKFFSISAGFVTINYDDSWWLGYHKHKDNNVYRINCLHPKGPEYFFFYPEPRDLLDVQGNALLQTVDPVIATGKTYTQVQKKLSCQLWRWKTSVKE